MFYYNIIDFEGIDPTKSNNSKECIVCYYWFSNHGFKFQNSVCNGCHDLTMLRLIISDFPIIIVKGLIIVVLFVTLGNVSGIYIIGKCMSKK